jgi:hypothetical protein
MSHYRKLYWRQPVTSYNAVSGQLPDYNRGEINPSSVRVVDHTTEARKRYFKRYTTAVSVSAGSGVGSPYISHECPADSLRFAAIHFLISSCASVMRL